MNDLVNDIAGLKHIENLYKNLTYLDQYGGSVMNLILITIVVLLIGGYCYAMVHAKQIRDNWQTDKCKLQVMPFAGFINAPKGTSWTDYTAQNFQQCLNNIQSAVAGEALEPITFVTNLMASIVNELKSALNSVRAMFDKVRTFFQSVTTEIMGRIINVMIPLQQIIIALKDFFGKCQGALTGGLFTLLGAFYTMQALMGAIAQMIITILILLAVVIMALWAVPFTWGAAGAMTAIFLGISVPMIIVLAFMLDKLKIKPDLSIPTIKCFDKNTELLLHDGSKKKIIDIQVGDILADNNVVTGCIKVTSDNSQMYNLNGIVVSDSHLVKYMNKWTHVSSHPQSIKINNYAEPFLYCLNTTTKVIQINDIIFADWDDLYDKCLLNTLHKHKLDNSQDIHKHLDGGFISTTHICLENGETKHIKDIQVGDILINNIKVYGTVVIDGTNLNEQYQINLGNNKDIEGGGKLHMYKENAFNVVNLNCNRQQITPFVSKCNKLYHLLTNEQFFLVKNTFFLDYNACIDF
jgi:hypothetical protein